MVSTEMRLISWQSGNNDSEALTRKRSNISDRRLIGYSNWKFPRGKERKMVSQASEVVYEQYIEDSNTIRLMNKVIGSATKLKTAIIIGETIMDK